MLLFLKLLILGIIQGLTEWLPISSSAHMILFSDLFGLNMYSDPLLNEQFFNLFLVVVQFGSILAVLVLFKKQLNPFDSKKTPKVKALTYGLWIKLAVACIPTIVVGLLVSQFVDHYFHETWIVALMLLVYGILFLIVENRPHPVKVVKLSQMDLLTALKIGAAQTVAIIPGTSRSGASILGAILLGVERKVACEFSFFLACPIMLGASILKLFEYAAGINWLGWISIFFATFVSFIVSMFAIKFLLQYVKNHNFKLFGYYRIILSIIVFISLFF